jgi:acetylornithine deacetylase/succinyl-diaminopimelate desuccinylase-like protein
MESQINQLLAFLRFPSISTDKAYADHVSACGEWLFQKFQTMGLQAEVRGTAGHPIVVARTPARAEKRTVLIYGHYDVQPVDPLEQWKSPPFEPVISDGIITARGASDNKGQIFAHILGVEEALTRTGGELPVNVIFLVEGEEEIGSPNLEKFLREHRDALRCDVVVISDTGMIAPGVPTFTYALRGIGVLEIKVTGPAMDLHSGIYGGAVLNPIAALARMLTSLHDENGRVAVEGFYDDVAPLQDWEKEAWVKLPTNDARIRELTGAPELFGESGYSGVERIWARPTVEINGIGGGYQGEGTKTVIPREAFAKLTFRLVPNQQPEQVVKQVKAHLERVCPKAVRVEFSGGHTGEPFLTDPHSRDGQAAQRALRHTFPGKEVALIREGGSIPITQSFKNILGTDTLLLGLALPDCRAHSPNETFTLENFEAGIRLNQSLLRELAL